MGASKRGHRKNAEAEKDRPNRHGVIVRWIRILLCFVGDAADGHETKIEVSGVARKIYGVTNDIVSRSREQRALKKK